MSLTLTFYSEIFADAHQCLPNYQTADADRKYILGRISHEGDKFATQLLPSLGKAAEASLITGGNLSVPDGFNLLGKSRLPSLLHFLFEGIWSADGFLLLNPDFLSQALGFTSELMKQGPRGDVSWNVEATKVYFIRQICLAFAKVRDMQPLQSDSEAVKAWVERVTAKPRITTPSWVLKRTRRLLLRTLLRRGWAPCSSVGAVVHYAIWQAWTRGCSIQGARS